MVVAGAVVLFVFAFLVPVVPYSGHLPANCEFCPPVLGIDYASTTYVLLGFGVYHTLYGAFVWG
jgi:hypothetical protein